MEISLRRLPVEVRLSRVDINGGGASDGHGKLGR
jgi:hypothetical protein